MTVMTLQKRVSENALYDFDFSNYAEFGDIPAETINTVTVTATPAGLTVGTPSVSPTVPTRVQVRCSGGTLGTTYTLTCTVTTVPNALTRELNGNLLIIADTA